MLLVKPDTVDMFIRNVVLRRGSFSQFMVETKSNKALQGLAVPERGRLLSKMYKALPAAELASLKQRASAIPKVNRVKAPKRQQRALSKYNLFVKENMSKFEGSIGTRMKSVAALWRKMK